MCPATVVLLKKSAAMQGRLLSEMFFPSLSLEVYSYRNLQHRKQIL